MTIWSRHSLIEAAQLSVGVSNGDGERFAAMFRRCWAQIPAKARAKLVEHWAEKSVSCELSNMWRDHDECFAQVEDGCKFRFNADAFRILPEDVASFIIAHEIAHAYLWADGTRQEIASLRMDTGEMIENLANSVAMKWKFKKRPRDTFKKLMQKVGFEEACRQHASRP